MWIAAAAKVDLCILFEYKLNYFQSIQQLDLQFCIFSLSLSLHGAHRFADCHFSELCVASHRCAGTSTSTPTWRCAQCIGICIDETTNSYLLQLPLWRVFFIE